MSKIVASVIDCYAFRHTAAGVEFLMLKRSPEKYLGGTWQGVHGRIEKKETAWAAALRELEEEAGLRPVRFWQLEAVNTFYMARKDRVVMCPCFAAEVAAGAAVALSDEHTDYRWEVAEAALTGFMWPGQKQAIREIIEVIIPGAPAEAHLRIALS